MIHNLEMRPGRRNHMQMLLNTNALRCMPNWWTEAYHYKSLPRPRLSNRAEKKWDNFDVSHYLLVGVLTGWSTKVLSKFNLQKSCPSKFGALSRLHSHTHPYVRQYIWVNFRWLPLVKFTCLHHLCFLTTSCEERYHLCYWLCNQNNTGLRTQGLRLNFLQCVKGRHHKIAEQLRKDFKLSDSQ